MAGEGKPGPSQVQPSIKIERPSNSSRLTKNNQKWDSLKDEIRRFYMTEDKPLPITMDIIKQKHGFTASERKWKSKLKEWCFDKHIPAKDMQILVAKAEKRARDDGKATVFLHGGSEVKPEKFEHFKRRKTTQMMEAASPSAETPTNITYHTPGGDLDDRFLERPARQMSVQAARAATPNASHNTRSKSPLGELAVVLMPDARLNGSSPMPESSLDSTANCDSPDQLDLHSTGMQPSRPVSVTQRSNESDYPEAIDVTEHLQDNFPFAPGQTTSSPTEESFIDSLSWIKSLFERATSPVDPRSENVIFLGDHPIFRDLLHDTIDNPEGQKISFDFSPLSVEQFQEVPSLNLEGSPANAYQLSSMSNKISRMPRDSTLSNVFATLVQSSEIFISKVAPYCVLFYEALGNLTKAYQYHCHWAEAILVVRLQLMGYETEKYPFSQMQNQVSEKLRILQCISNLARLFEKTGDLEMAESHYRAALEGIERMGYRNPPTSVDGDPFHECHLAFSEFLLRLDRDGEALHLLIGLVIRETPTWAKIFPTSGRLFELLEKVFLKIDPSGVLKIKLSHILAMTKLDWQWDGSWCLFADLAEELSILGMFDNAELLFKFAASKLWGAGYGANREMRNHSLKVLQVQRKYAEHYQSQKKWVKSVELLEMAFSRATLFDRDLGSESRPAFHIEEQKLDHLLDKAGEELSAESQKTSIQEAFRDADAARLGYLASRETRPQNLLGMQEDSGDLNPQNDDDGFSTTWTTSTKSYKYGTTYSVSDITGISDSGLMVP